MDLAAVQGVWDVIELEVDGQAMSAGVFSGAQIVIEGDHFITLGMGPEYSGTICGDDTVSPNRLDMHYTAGPHAGKASLAICEISGDVWRMCLCLAGGTRPVEFKTAAGTGHVLETLRRSGTGAKPIEAYSTVTFEAAGPPFASDKADPDLALITGNWSMNTLTRNGEPFPSQILKYGKRTATNEIVRVTIGGDVVVHAKYRIDSTSTPKSMDYELLEGADKGRQYAGIYRIDGDTLTTFMSAPGRERPSDFESAPDDGRTLAVWKRDARR